MKKFLCFVAIGLLFACAKKPDTPQADYQPDGVPSAQSQASQNNAQQGVNLPVVGADGKISLDLEKLATGVAKTDVTTYQYPFDKDSVAVQNYAKAYAITAQEAQQAMTLSMASPEVLGKVLDQLVGEYKGHSLTDGKAMSLVVYTSDRVNPIQFDYVIADKFGEGLVLPVKVVPISQTQEKPQVDIDRVSQKFKNDDE